MNDTKSYRDKGRAVFLSAIMVLSVVAMSAAFAGSAAAITPQELEVGNISADDDDFADEIEGSTVAEGLTYNITNDTDGETIYIGENNLTEDIGEEIHVMDSDNNSVDDILIRNASEGSDKASFELDVDGLDGTYTLSDTPTSSGDFTEEFSVSPQDFEAEWDEDSVTETDTDVDVELDIDRNVDPENYNVTVWADGLDYDQVDALFNHDGQYVVNDSIGDGEDDAEGQGDYLPFTTLEDDFDIDINERGDADFDENDEYEELVDEGIVTFKLNESFLDRGDDPDLVANFTSLDDEDYPDADEYDFDFLITDTGDHDTDAIEIGEDDVDADFSQGVYTQTAGDIVDITVELEDTSDAYIQFGDEDAGFVDALYVEDDSDNDEVNFQVNTRMVGVNVSDTDDVYYSEDDEIESVFVNEGDTADLEDLTFYDDSDTDPGDEIDYDEYLDELGLIDVDDDNIDDQLVRPLQPTDYDLTVGDEHFIAEDDESEIDDEYDSAILDLTEPGVENINTWVAPGDDADEDDELDDLTEVITERSDIAVEDRLIVEAEASGMFGLLANQSDNELNELDETFTGDELNHTISQEGEGINFEVEADDAVGNQDPTEIDLEGVDDESDAVVLVDEYESTFYLIVDTDSDEAFSNGEFEDGQSWTAELEYETDDDDRFRFGGDDEDEFLGGADGDTDEAAFPYLGTDSTQSVSTSFDAVEPEATFDNLDEDDHVQIEADDDVSVTGETNVAPGSDGDLRISNAGDTPSFLSTQDAEIDSDGSFEASGFEFDDREEGDEAEIDFRIDGSTIDDADGIFVEAVEEVDDEEVDEEDDEEVEEDDEEVEEDDDEPEPEEDDDEPEPEPEEDDDEPEEPEDDGVPGFGIAVALFALIAAGMLALRRQN